MILLLACPLYASAKAKATKLLHTKESLAEIKENLSKEKFIMIDVRELKEWESKRLKNSIHIPLSILKSKEEKWKEKIPVDKTLYIHCYSGGRALIAGRVLMKKGYKVIAVGYSLNELFDSGL